METLTLYIDLSRPLGNGLFESLSWKGETGDVATKSSDGDFPANAKKGVTALCFLVVLTDYQRKVGSDNVPPRFHGHLKTLRAAWGKGGKCLRDWLVKFFTEDEIGGCFDLDSEGSQQKISFSDRVEVRLENCLSGKELTKNDIIELNASLAGVPPRVPPMLRVEIDAGEFIITSDDDDGALTQGLPVRLTFESNFEGQWAIFWITSKGAITELFPTLQVSDFPYKHHEMKQRGRGMQLAIPGTRHLVVGQGFGTESCLAFCNTQPFTKGVLDSIEKILVELMRMRRSAFPFPHFGFQPCFFEDEDDEQASELRLEAPALENEWELSLKSRLRPLVERFWIFHLPNLRP